MNNWQLDILKDQADTKAWNELNAPDPNEKQLKAAAVSLFEAVAFLQIAESRLADAMAELFDTPIEYKIGSFLDSLQESRIDLQEMAKKFQKGERE